MRRQSAVAHWCIGWEWKLSKRSKAVSAWFVWAVISQCRFVTEQHVERLTNTQLVHPAGSAHTTVANTCQDLRTWRAVG